MHQLQLLQRHCTTTWETKTQKNRPRERTIWRMQLQQVNGGERIDLNEKVEMNGTSKFDLNLFLPQCPRRGVSNGAVVCG
jgi:hypothetical protein